MSHIKTTAAGVGATFVGAAVAAFIGMGSAYADDSLTPDPYEDLFGGSGTVGLSAGQIRDDASLDTQLAAQSLGNAASFDAYVDNFEEAGTAHPLTQLIYGLDPSAFAVQHDPDITGYLTAAAGSVDGVSDAGGYLVPDDFLGYVAVDLDAFLLNPTGLGPLLLGPVIDLLLGFPASP